MPRRRCRESPHPTGSRRSPAGGRISSRYQRRIVSGVTRPANAPSRRRCTRTEAGLVGVGACAAAAVTAIGEDSGGGVALDARGLEEDQATGAAAGAAAAWAPRACSGLELRAAECDRRADRRKVDDRAVWRDAPAVRRVRTRTALAHELGGAGEAARAFAVPPAGRAVVVRMEAGGEEQYDRAGSPAEHASIFTGRWPMFLPRCAAYEPGRGC